MPLFTDRCGIPLTNLSRWHAKNTEPTFARVERVEPHSNPALRLKMDLLGAAAGPRFRPRDSCSLAAEFGGRVKSGVGDWTAYALPRYVINPWSDADG